MAISKYENDHMSPSSDVLMSIASATRTPLEYFFRSTEVNLENVQFRRKGHSSLMDERKVAAIVVEALERHMDALNVFPHPPIEPLELPTGLPAQVESLESVSNVASLMRSAWQLGTNPIPNMTHLLESRGVFVIPCAVRLGGKVDGISGIANGFPVVIVAEEWPGDRRRFTLAHELGHMVLDDRLGGAVDLEKACDRFAASFLLPPASLRDELGNARTSVSWPELVQVKQAWGVSMLSALLQIRDQGIVPTARVKTLLNQFYKKGWGKREPVDLPVERPQLLRRLVHRAFAEEWISEGRAAELLCVSRQEFAAQWSVTS